MLNIKNSTITSAGYEYQNMYGVLILADWLCYPEQYKRICFEAGQDGNNAPKGLDDMVCERSDGTVDFYQIKFTPNADKEDNKLSWKWLLKRKGKTENTRSLLKKLFDALQKILDSKLKLGKVTLVTNKKPSREFEACLKDNKIYFSLLPSSSRSKARKID
jgi:hypothetical protein